MSPSLWSERLTGILTDLTGSSPVQQQHWLKGTVSRSCATPFNDGKQAHIVLVNLNDCVVTKIRQSHAHGLSDITLSGSEVAKTVF